MFILVAAAFEAGSTLAHAINVVKMAEGFAMLGHQVTIACRSPIEKLIDTQTLKYMYALQSEFSWIQLPATHQGKYLDAHWDFAKQLIPQLVFKRPDFVYSRNYILPWLSSFLRIPTAAESHAHPMMKSSPFNRFIKASLHHKFHALVTISPILSANFVNLGVQQKKVLILPDAVDLHVFSPPKVLPPSPYSTPVNAVYSGHLYDYKGIPTILVAAGLLPGVTFHLVGGLDEDVQRIRSEIASSQLKNVLVHGYKPRTELPPYLWHSDILLLPPSAKHPSAQWTSPVKLGEYLASGKPIISTDIPALRFWLTDEQTKFVVPDNPESLVNGIRWVLTHQSEARNLALNAQKLATTLSYSQRAKSILTFCGM